MLFDGQAPALRASIRVIWNVGPARRPIVLVDFWPKGARYQRQMFYIVMAVFTLSMIPVAYVMLGHLHL